MTLGLILHHCHYTWRATRYPLLIHVLLLCEIECAGSKRFFISSRLDATGRDVSRPRFQVRFWGKS